MRCGSNCSNCEPDEEEFLAVDVLKKDISIDAITEPTLQLEETCNASYTADSDSSSISSKNSITTAETTDNPSLEVCSISYFASYLAKKCWDKFGCTNCNLSKKKDNLNDKTNLLILFRTYNDIEPTQGLKAPTDEFLDMRLSDLMVIAVEKEDANKIDLDEAVDKFSKQKVEGIS
ncbi:hypothetical protein QTP88_017041 [Uroleucon formosanum]